MRWCSGGRVLMVCSRPGEFSASSRPLDSPRFRQLWPPPDGAAESPLARRRSSGRQLRGTPPETALARSCFRSHRLSQRPRERQIRQPMPPSRRLSRIHVLVAAHQAGELQFFNGHAALANPQDFATFLAPLRNSEWVVYSKRPFGGPKQVLRYLARYTHRVAISNRRLIACNEKGVTFKWKD